jgi:hypothetical protein
MQSQPWFIRGSLIVFSMALVVAPPARAQYGTLANAGYPTTDLYGRGYGSTPTGGYGAFPFGYAPYNGAMGSGYQGAGALINHAALMANPPANVAARPVFDVATAAPGWYSPARRARRRPQAQPDAAVAPPFDDTGKVVWPHTIPDDPAIAGLRKSAEEAVRTVYRDWKANGHASVRPVIDAKNKLTAYERKVLPEVKRQNATEAAALENYFVHLDKALDVLTFRK